jgi:tRNA-specific 2-thiouridylase
MRTAANKRVIVGMSGGVDSSVSAALLLESGYAVEGLYMFNWAEDEQGYCTAAEDFQDARQVCDHLNITLHRADFSKEYRERVFRYFIDEYAAGRTPNPDVLCNREIKFGSFLDHARKLGADLIATGHYAKLEHGSDGPRLMRSRDTVKDQTYFLCMVPAEALASALFPLAEMTKPEVRQKAADLGIPNHDKRDSTGICFIGERRFREFLSGYLPAQPGPIRAKLASGSEIILGQHQGLMYYTLGQRRGLGIGGHAGTDERPWYVTARDLDTNTLWVSQDSRHALLRSSRLRTDPVHWIGSSPSLPYRCSGRIRHRHADQPCTVTESNGSIEVRFEEPQQAPAPGQFVAFYNGDHCRGGAAIRAVLP